MTRRTVVLSIGAAAAVGLAFAVWRMAAPARPAAPAAADLGGAFVLVDQDGRASTDRDLIGKPSVLFFGYTSCPDVCPATLGALTQQLKVLGPDSDRLNLRFVTVDPQRDTPARLKAWLAAFDPRIRGLTGSPAAVARAARAYNVYAARVDLPGGGYAMDHSSSLYLQDARGRVVEQVNAGEAPEVVLEGLKRLLKPAGG